MLIMFKAQLPKIVRSLLQTLHPTLQDFESVSDHFEMLLKD